MLQYYTCGNCLFNELPYKNSNLQNLEKSINLEDSRECQRKVIIENNSKNLSITHLNTQSLCSTFDEFSVFLHTYCFDILALSETWLKNNKHMLEYVQIEGYNSEFINREGRTGGGVGLYVKECLKYKVGKDTFNFETDVGHIWIELPIETKIHQFWWEYFIRILLIIHLKLNC